MRVHYQAKDIEVVVINILLYAVYYYLFLFKTWRIYFLSAECQADAFSKGTGNLNCLGIHLVGQALSLVATGVLLVN